jgi:RND family efflux transporter MFP subunit
MKKAKNNHWWYVGALVAALVVLSVGIIGGQRLYSSPPENAEAPQENETEEVSLRVDTVQPTKGGLIRRTSQPGSAHSWESAELYAKISGYLLAQHVDIGSHVKRGDLLAELDVPELHKDVEAAAANYEQAKAEVAQAEARVASAFADFKASQSRVAQSKAEADRFEAEVDFQQKQFDRLSALSEQNAIEARVVDEQKLQLDSAQANRRAAQSSVVAAEQQALAAESRVALAKADLDVTKAKLRVAESQLERVKVIAGYTRIVSPYDGVVTLRNFHRGAYIRSPDQGGQVPLLAVDYTDRMRVLVRIPEREVPFIQAGDKAAVKFDALPSREFTGTVARIAESEDSATRTMLAEVDVDNPDHVIRDHMYGRVEIELEAAPQGVTIPSHCLVGDVVDDSGQVFVVEDGVARLRKVKVGRDTGIEAEVLSGLTTGDAVIMRPPGGLADGAAVVAAAKIAAK